MKEFTKKNLPKLSDDIDAALAKVAAKHGISLKTGNARFSAQTVTFKLEATVNNADGTVQDKYAIALEAIYPDLVGKQITLNGNTQTVVGYNSRSRKWEFHVKGNDGKIRTTTRAVVMGRN